jgi:radical SAM superfamily enzyme YgiQ (UPF0313 family)
MDKGLRISAVHTARQRLRRAGIRACYFLQLGYPGERWQELQETITFVRNTRPDDIGVSFSYPLPGTVFYERVREQLGSKRNWADSDDLCIMFQAEYTSEFYRAVRDALHAESDTWSATSDYSEEALDRVQAMWRKVYALEPASRNPDALDLPAKATSIRSHVTRLIPVQQLSGTTGA